MTRFPFLFLFAWLQLFLCSAVAQMTFNLPQVANGGGLITTTIVAFNNSNRRAEVAIDFKGDDGGALQLDFVGEGLKDRLRFGLEPGETRFLKTTGQGDLQVGAATATSTAPIGLSTIFSIIGPQGVLTEAGIGASEPTQSFVISVDTVAPFNTGIAIQDLSGTSNEVTFSIGSGQKTTRTLPASGHLSVFVAGPGGLFPNLQEVQGRMTVGSEGPVAAVTLRQGSTGAPLTTFPVVPTDSTQTSFELPQVAIGSTISTQFIIFGIDSDTPSLSQGAPRANAGTVNLQLTDDDGVPFSVSLKNGQSGSRFDFPLESTGALFLETALAAEVRTGAARVESTIPIGVTAVFRLLDDSSNVITEAGVGDSPATTAFTLPVDQTGDLGTGVAFFNNSGQLATIDFEFIEGPDDVATSTDTRKADLPKAEVSANAIPNLAALGHTARFVSELVPAAAGKTGQLAITSDVPISALTLRQGANTLTTLPVSEGVAGGSNDLVRTETGVDLAQVEFGTTGKGVLIAVMDRGIDYEHPDFIRADGTSRIHSIVDLSDDSGAAAPGNTIGAGTIYTGEQINAALTSETRLDTRDAVGHGTVTAGIAGGNGRASRGRFLGIAPDATFIIVKFTSEGAPPHDGEPAETPFFASQRLAEVLDYILNQSEELEMPVVVSANFGSIQGPADGTSTAARQIDARFGPGRPGRVFLTGTSDDGGASNHAGGTVGQGQTIDLEISKGHPGNLRFNLWYPESDRFEVTIVTPSGTFGPFDPPATNAIQASSFEADFSYFHNGAAVDFFGATSARREILIDFGGPTGDYIVRLRGTTITNGRFDAVLNPANIFSAPNNGFETFVEPGHTVWEWATAFSNISPNSYVLQPFWTDIDGFPRTDIGNGVGPGALWPGSGVGPTDDGRRGVTVSAPGNSNIGAYATRSFFASFRSSLVQGGGGLYGTLGFVSGANPVVTGIVALMLESDPTLDAAEVQDILGRTARQDAFTGPVPNPEWGSGKIDAFAAVQEVLRLKAVKAEEGR